MIAALEKLEPLETQSILEYAERFVVLPSAYARPGPFKIRTSGYLVEPWEALQDPLIKEVTVMKATQTGGSLVGDIYTSWRPRVCPAPMFYNMQTDEDAKAHATLRINKLLDNTAPLKLILPQGHKGKNVKRVTQEIVMQMMWLIVQGANLSSLQSKSVCVSINDEIVFWQPDSLLRDADARLTAFAWQRKAYDCSQGGMVGDALDGKWKGGTMEDWAFICPKCENGQPYKWTYNNNHKERGGMKWEKDETSCPGGVWDYEGLESTIRYECRQCGHEITDVPKNRRMLSDGGHYIRLNPSAPRSRRSFHWSALACEAIPWADIVWEWVNEVVPQFRQGNREPLQKFIQKKLAESDDESVNYFDAQTTEGSDYSFNEQGKVPTWDDEFCRFMAIDKQIDHYWYVVRAFSKIGTSRLIAWGRAESDEELDLIAKEHEVKAQHVCIDSGAWATDCYMLACVYGWRCLKGDKDEKRQGYRWKDPNNEEPIWKPYAPPVRREPLFGMKAIDLKGDKVRKFKSRRKYQAAKLCRWSNPLIKDFLFNLRAGMGLYWGVPANVGQVYLDQMNGEQRRLKTDPRGKKSWEWKEVGRAGCHLRDCECMLLVLAAIRGLLMGRTK